MVAIPKKGGNVRVAVNYKKLNAISSLVDNFPFPASTRSSIPWEKDASCPCST